MLVSYPVAAAGENWLHDGLVAVLTRAIDGIPDPMADWLDLFPAEHREAVKRKTSLSDRLGLVVETIVELDVPSRTKLRACLVEQNRLPHAFSSLIPPPLLPAQPPELRTRVSSLFECAFKLLSSLGIRDRQYHAVYSATPGRVCGFCGLERLSAPVPGTPREHLDHYLAFSIYPLAGANLRNLAPIGGRCNTAYKRDVDMLRTAQGVARRCFDPYGGHQARITLLNSRPLRGPRRGTDILPQWDVELTGADADRLVAWDEAFRIRHRYRHDVLDPDFSDWLDHFAVWTADDPPVDLPSLLQRIRHYLRTVVQERPGEATFLRRATFEMLERTAQIGPDASRITKWLLSLWDPEEGVVF